MQSHTRALIAASTYAVVTGKPVAGLYDHTAARHLLVAAESRGGVVQGSDGERSVAFGGTLPEIYDAGDKAFISLETDGEGARGYDRTSGSHYVAQVKDRLINLYDYGQGAWFAFEPQSADDTIPSEA